MDQPQDEAEGTSVSQPGVGAALVAPNGLKQILTTFGDIYKYIRPDGSLDPRWQADFLERMALPFPLLLSWDHSKSVNKITCHKLVTAVFAAVFARIQERGLQARSGVSADALPSDRSGREANSLPTVGALRSI